MVISPVINGFGALFFLLSAIVYKYLFIWVYNEPVSQDTGGRFFPKAINHVFVGMYVQEICLCTLFFLARDESGASSIPQAVLMIVLIVITVSRVITPELSLYTLSLQDTPTPSTLRVVGRENPGLTVQAGIHYVMNHSYGPLLDALPLSLSHLQYQDGQNVEAEFGAGELAPGIADKIVKTGEKVLAPIAAPTKDQTDKVLKMGKQVLAQIKTTPDERRRQQGDEKDAETPVSPLTAVSPIDRRARTAATSTPMAAIALPTAPGPPQGPVSELPAVDTGPDLQRAIDGHPVMGDYTNYDAEQRERKQEMEMQQQERARTRESDETAVPSTVNQSGSPKHNTDDSSDDDEAEDRTGAANSATSPISPEGNAPPHPDAEAQKEDETAYFALPGGPGVINQDEVDGNDPNAFFHPATKEPQMILWLPADELGLCAAELEANAEMGVKSSSRRAKLDARGKVRITGPPPKH